MKRRNLNKKETDQLKKAQLENIKLKRQVSSLRRQLSRVDLEGYAHIKDTLEALEAEDNEDEVRESLEQHQKTWECFDCGVGVLKLTMVSKMGEPFYFRKCDHCSKRTKLKPFQEGVKP